MTANRLLYVVDSLRHPSVQGRGETAGILLRLLDSCTIRKAQASETSLGCQKSRHVYKNYMLIEIALHVLRRRVIWRRKLESEAKCSGIPLHYCDLGRPRSTGQGFWLRTWKKFVWVAWNVPEKLLV